MVKIKKIKIVIGGLVAVIVINMIGIMLFNRFVKIVNNDLVVSSGEVNLQIAPNYFIKTHLGDDAKEPLNQKGKTKSLGDYPIGYKPLPLAQIPNEKFMSVEMLNFNVIMKELPDAEPTDNEYHKNNVSVEMTPIHTFQNLPKKENLAKSQLNPELAKVTSEVTLMDCKVQRNTLGGKNRFRDVVCVWEDEKKLLPDLYMKFTVDLIHDDYAEKERIFHIARVFTFLTSYKELGVNVRFDVKEEHLDQWPSIHAYIHELAHGFKAI